MRQKTIIGVDCAIKSIVNRIEVGLNQPKGKKFMLVAIAGGNSSGKTFLVKKLKAIFSDHGYGVCGLHLDNYCKNQNCPGFPFDGIGRAIYHLPASYALDKLKVEAVTLLAGKTVTGPSSDKKSSERLPWPRRVVVPKEVIIVEGLFAVQAVMGVRGVLKVFMDTDANIRIKRRVKRDMAQLHKTEDEVLRFIRELVEPYYLDHVWPQKNLAQISVINND